MKKLILVGMAMLMATSANATEDFCAVVLQSPGGFLALREGPGTQFKMLAKLHRGDYLETHTGPCDEVNGHTICNRNWTHVEEVYSEGKPLNLKGWVLTRYTQGFLCPEQRG